MTTVERNRHLRQLANEISASVAPVIGLEFVPKCRRITRRRGHGDITGFSVPIWAASGPTEYFSYYVAHEVCHAAGDYGHGPSFRALELKALAAVGLAPVYQNAGAGPYVSELRDFQTGAPLVRREGLKLPVKVSV